MSTPPPTDLRPLALLMRSSLPLKDRLWLNLKFYHQTFLGSDALKFLESHGGVDVGNQLIREGWCWHVCKAHYFEPGGPTLFYEWNESKFNGSDNSIVSSDQVKILEEEIEILNDSLRDVEFRVGYLESRVAMLINIIRIIILSVSACIIWFYLNDKLHKIIATSLITIISIYILSHQVNPSDSSPSPSNPVKTLRRKMSRIFTTEIPVSQRTTVPHPSEWKNYPVYLCAEEGGELPLNSEIPFETELFKGRLLVRVRGMGSEDYFKSRSRKFQCIVQGKFKEDIEVNDLLTGHEFARGLKNLPPNWILNVGERLIKRLAPSTVVELRKSINPKAMSVLGATSQVLRIDMFGQECDIKSYGIEEENKVFGGIFEEGLSSIKRKKVLTKGMEGLKYEKESVYTFDFYQHLLDCKRYEIDFGVKKVKLDKIVDGQPLQILAKTRDGRVAWKFYIWHESLVDSRRS